MESLPETDAEDLTLKWTYKRSNALYDLQNYSHKILSTWTEINNYKIIV